MIYEGVSLFEEFGASLAVLRLALCEHQKWKEQEKISGTASLRSVALEYKIWWQFKRICMKKLLDDKSCSPATFSLINLHTISDI